MLASWNPPGAEARTIGGIKTHVFKSETILRSWIALGDRFGVIGRHNRQPIRQADGKERGNTQRAGNLTSDRSPCFRPAPRAKDELEDHSQQRINPREE